MLASKAFTFTSAARVNVLHCPVNVSMADVTTTAPVYQGFTAIWDTGATASVITKNIADKLVLKPIGMTRVSTAGGMQDCNVYLVNITLPNKINIVNVKVTEAPLNGFDVLIGMDIIALGDFAVSSDSDGRTTVSYRIPGGIPVDFVDQLEKKQARSTQTKSLKAKHKKERQAKIKSRRK